MAFIISDNTITDKVQSLEGKYRFKVHYMIISGIFDRGPGSLGQIWGNCPEKSSEKIW